MKRSIFFISLCFLLSALIFLAFSTGVSAQTSYEIKGIVKDSVSKKALDYITIGLKNDKNEPLKTSLTKDDGSFAIADIKTGKYVLSVIAMGYKLKTINLTLAGNSDLGTIYIVPQVTGLDAVTVIADRPIVKMDIDKISYDLQADPESKVNNVLEMMRKVPLLSLDAEDNIQLKGSASYRILINGRPSSMLEKSPKDILRSMPASTIQSIEVITNPPAKYDGEGLTGIINIVTVKKIDNGYNGTINFNQRFPSGGPNLGSSFNFKQGKWGISANLNGVLFHDPGRTNVHNRLILGTNPSDLKQDG
ncbi:MAG: carboxypeptidase regulatory-like domain-containing protein, partial [Pedobacter sp.]